MARMVAVSLAIVLAACTQHQSGNQAAVDQKVTEPKTGGNVAGASGEAPNSANRAATETVAGSASADAAMRFLGTWARSKAECASKPWTFTAKAATVAGGRHCSVYHVSRAPGGYNLAATCPSKEPVHADLIKLRFAESAQAMLVESNAIPPTGLVYCGK